MISVPLHWLVFICLLVCLTGIFFVWIWYESIRRRREKHSIRNRLRCRVCCMDFEDRSPDPLAKCPRCGSLNERSAPLTL